MKGMASFEDGATDPKKHLYRNSNNDQMSNGPIKCDSDYKPIYYNTDNGMSLRVLLETSMVRNYDNCGFEITKPIYLNNNNFQTVKELEKRTVIDWESVSCSLDLMKPIYYYTWNDMYVFKNYETEMPKVMDEDECGFKMPLK